MSIYYDGELDVTGGVDGINVTIGDETAHLHGFRVEELLQKLSEWHKRKVEFAEGCKPDRPQHSIH